MTFKKNVSIFLPMLLLSLSSCSLTILRPTMLSYKQAVTTNKGLEVSGFSDSVLGSKSRESAIMEAAKNALSNAGPEFDVLTNVVVKVKIRLFSVRYIVTGEAHKSTSFLIIN